AFVDGSPIGAPSLWTSRSDLTALFPVATYPGVASALGIIGFDSTTLANGVHDIFWIVAGSKGEADGIGSRVFTVANGAHLSAAPGRPPAPAPAAGASSATLDAPAMMPPIRALGSAADLRPSSLAAEVNAAAADWRPIRGRRGFDMDASLRALDTAADGR